MKKSIVLFVLITFFFIFSKTSSAVTYSFAVIGDPAVTPEIQNIYIMFNNLNITYKPLFPSDLIDASVFNNVDGIISFADSSIINPTLVNDFAKNHLVISHSYDFANYYSSLSGYYNIVKASSDNYPVTYLIDWGNFRANDKVEMQYQDKRSLGVFLTSQLDSTFPSNLTKITQYNSTHTASFLVNNTPKTGFYVMDLKATTNETEWAGIWHTFPAVKMVKDFPTGKYSRWMSNGSRWWDINWVYNRIDTLASQNSDIATKTVIGKSLGGRDIVALMIGKGNRNMIIDGSIHGNEKIGTFSALRVAELLLESYRSNPSWQSKLNQYKIIIIPILNPDGFVNNTRENANSSLSPDIYRNSGSIMTTNGSWISHGLLTSPAGIEGQYCIITPQDPNVNGVVIKTTSSSFQVGLTNKSDGNPITIPTNINWDCRETCCNLNRQFPPKTPTEPEVLALINLFNEYPPVIYFNMHEGGATQCPDPTYTLDMYVGPYISGTYSNFAKYALHEANDTFTSLNHWGRFIEGGCNVPINKARIISVSGSDGTAHTYGSYSFRNTSSVILETYVWSSTWGARKSLWGLDYYPSIILSHLKYYDNDGNFLFSSNGFISSTNMIGNTLTITLDTSELTTSSLTFINDLKNRGKPTEVFIDNVKKNEGDGWIYDSISKNINITGASNSIIISWSQPVGGLVGYWKFDEGSGNTVTDSSGNNNNGNIMNLVSGVIWNVGKFGNGLKFLGTNGYINIPNSTTLDFNKTNNSTISLWVKVDSENRQDIINSGWWWDNDGFNIEYNVSPGYLAIRGCFNGIDVSDNQYFYFKPFIGYWTHLVFDFDTDMTRLYVNGMKVVEKNLGGSLCFNENKAVKISGTHYYLNGSIDEVKIFLRSLSEQEIQEIDPIIHDNQTLELSYGTLSDTIVYENLSYNERSYNISLRANPEDSSRNVTVCTNIFDVISIVDAFPEGPQNIPNISDWDVKIFKNSIDETFNWNITPSGFCKDDQFLSSDYRVVAKIAPKIKIIANYNNLKSISNMSYGVQLSGSSSFGNDWLTGGPDQSLWNITKKPNFSTLRIFDLSMKMCESWNSTSHQCNEWNWTIADMAINSIINLDIEPLMAFYINFYQPWEPTEGVPGMDIHWNNTSYPSPDDFANYISEIVKHYNVNPYHYNIKYWEVINEPPVWGSTIENLTAFVKVYNKSREKIKAVDPSALTGVNYINSKSFFDFLVNYSDDIDFGTIHPYEGTSGRNNATLCLNNATYCLSPNNQYSYYTDLTLLNRASSFYTFSSYGSLEQLRSIWKQKRGKDLEIFNSESDINTCGPYLCDPRQNNIMAALWYATKCKTMILDGSTLSIYYQLGSYNSNGNIYGGFGHALIKSSYSYEQFPSYWSNYLLSNYIPKGSIIYDSTSNDSSIVDSLAVKTANSNNILLINKMNISVDVEIPILGFSIKNATLHVLDQNSYKWYYNKTLNKAIITYSNISTIDLPKNNVQNIKLNGYAVAILEVFRDSTNSYTVSISGSTVSAKNDQTGIVEFSGTDAAKVINSTLNALTPGGSVLIKSGTYMMSTNVSIHSYTKLYGEGYSTILKNSRPQGRGKMAGILLNEHLGGETHVWDTNITISDLTIDGDMPNHFGFGITLEDANNLTLSNLYMKNVDADAIGFNGFDNGSQGGRGQCNGTSTNVIIQNVLCEDEGVDCLELHNVTNFYINNITSIRHGTRTDTNGNGITLACNTNHGLVFNVTAINSTGGSLQRSNGLTFYAGSHDVNITDLTAENNNGRCIHIESSAKNIILTNMQCLKNKNYGIYIKQSSDVKIINAEVDFNTYDGILLIQSHNINVTQSNIKSNTGNGVWLNYSSYSNNISSNSICNNLVNINTTNQGSGNIITNNDVICTEDIEKPRWSNFKRDPPEPTIITTLDSVTLNVTWYDNQNLDKILIWENSTGGWQGHVVYP